MQGVKRYVQQHSIVLEIPIFSYKNVFNDGEDKLHPAMWCGALFALSRVVYPGMEHIRLSSDQVKSEHTKKSKGFLIKAPNQDAELLYTSPAGSLLLTEGDFKKLSLLGADINYFHHSTTTTMFEQINSRTIATGAFAQIQALFVDAEGKPSFKLLQDHFGLPGTLSIGGKPVTEPADIFSHVQAWAKDYLASPEDQRHLPYLPFVAGGVDGKGNAVNGFIPASEQLWAAIKASATNNILEVFTDIKDMSTTDGVYNEAEANAYIATQLTDDEAGFNFAQQAMDINPETVVPLAAALGLDVPAAFLPADPAAAAAAIETAVAENTESVGGGVPAEEVATDAPVEEAAPEVVAETPVDAPADTLEINTAPEDPAAPAVDNLPAQVTGNSLPAGFVAVNPKVLHHAGVMANALGDMLKELSQPVAAEVPAEEDAVVVQ